MKVKIGPYRKNDKQKVKIKIHNYDVWNLDGTMARILLPMFKHFKKIKHGAPHVDDDDVPVEIRSTSAKTIGEYENDEYYFARYDWILNEIIWALTETHPKYEYRILYKKTVSSAEKFDARAVRIKNAFRLMGKYWQTFWD